MRIGEFCQTFGKEYAILRVKYSERISKDRTSVEFLLTLLYDYRTSGTATNEKKASVDNLPT